MCLRLQFRKPALDKALTYSSDDLAPSCSVLENLLEQPKGWRAKSCVVISEILRALKFSTILLQSKLEALPRLHFNRYTQEDGRAVHYGLFAHDLRTLRLSTG